MKKLAGAGAGGRGAGNGARSGVTEIGLSGRAQILPLPLRSHALLAIDSSRVQSPGRTPPRSGLEQAT